MVKLPSGRPLGPHSTRSNPSSTTDGRSGSASSATRTRPTFHDDQKPDSFRPSPPVIVRPDLRASMASRCAGASGHGSASPPATSSTMTATARCRPIRHTKATATSGPRSASAAQPGAVQTAWIAAARPSRAAPPDTTIACRFASFSRLRPAE